MSEEELLAAAAIDPLEKIGITLENIRSILTGQGDRHYLSIAAKSANTATEETVGTVKLGSIVRRNEIESFEKFLNASRTLFQEDSKSQDLFFAQIMDLTAEITEFTMKTVGVIAYCLYTNSVKVAPLVRHTVSTAVISGKIGSLLKFNKKEMTVLILAALLHDFGCMKLPDRMRMSKEKLSEADNLDYQKHVFHSANALKTKKTVPRETVIAVLQHHENIDGTGYPQKLKGDQISIYARILALANRMDRETHKEEVGEKSLDISELIKELSYWTKFYDYRLCAIVTKYLEEFIYSNKVMLSDGRQAAIIYRHFAMKDPILQANDGEIIDINKQLIKIERYTI